MDSPRAAPPSASAPTAMPVTTRRGCDRPGAAAWLLSPIVSVMVLSSQSLTSLTPGGPNWFDSGVLGGAMPEDVQGLSSSCASCWYSASGKPVRPDSETTWTQT